MIYYFCPDFAPPSGGTRRLYRHVYQLNRMGLEATVVHKNKGFLLRWHDYRVPIRWLQDKLVFEPHDVMVFPEGMVNLMKQTRDFQGARIVIALNWANIYSALPGLEVWQDYGITSAITPCPIIRAFIEWSMGINVTLIGNYVDNVKYRFEAREKKKKISYMTRKTGYGDTLQKILVRKRGRLSEYEWVPFEWQSESKYARELRESKIYLATGVHEGVNSSVLEAMASGCLVIGFSGVGGDAYMVGEGEGQNCILVENGNVPALGKVLERSAAHLEKGEKVFSHIIQNGIETAKRFWNFEREALSLKKFFEKTTEGKTHLSLRKQDPLELGFKGRGKLGCEDLW